ncbi:MAG: hypothetical protein IPK26_03820 [Planctomycetes bacterium]|nr:hypothetical protein [Planctomycetota bacterium]
MAEERHDPPGGDTASRVTELVQQAMQTHLEACSHAHTLLARFALHDGDAEIAATRSDHAELAVPCHPMTGSPGS